VLSVHSYITPNRLRHRSSCCKLSTHYIVTTLLWHVPVMKLSKNDDKKLHRKLENLPCSQSYEIKQNRRINKITIDSSDLNDLYEYVISLEIGFDISEKYDMQIASSRVQQYSRNTYCSNAMYTTQFRTSWKIRAGGVSKSEKRNERHATAHNTENGPQTIASPSTPHGKIRQWCQRLPRKLYYYYVYVCIQ